MRDSVIFYIIGNFYEIHYYIKGTACQNVHLADGKLLLRNPRGRGECALHILCYIIENCEAIFWSGLVRFVLRRYILNDKQGRIT